MNGLKCELVGCAGGWKRCGLLGDVGMLGLNGSLLTDCPVL